MSGWLTEAQVEALHTQYLMGTEWGQLTPEQRANLNDYVGARWTALPWFAAKFPKLTAPSMNTRKDRTLDASLMQAYALHLRFLTQTQNPLVDQEADADVTVDILSDLPATVRNILIGGGYVRVKAARIRPLYRVPVEIQ